MSKYFKGYYYKHQKGENIISFIVGKSGNEEFIQIITKSGSFNIPYIGNNLFSREGIKIDICYNRVNISGEIKYSDLTPINYDIMGPFKYLKMECSHEIVSMHHRLDGGIFLNGEYIDFSNGVGYIEGDSGISFPSKYMWIHCNDFDSKCSIVMSVAKIPFGLFSFNGCICNINHLDKEYRIATYLGAKIIKSSNNIISLEQGKYKIEAEVFSSDGHILIAPNMGKMNKLIYENIACYARFRFYINGNTFFDLIGKNTSFENVS